MPMERLEVKILNSTLELETDQDPLLVSQLAGYVNNKLRQVSSEQDTNDTTKIFCIGLLTLAEEIFKLEKEKNNVIKCPLCGAPLLRSPGNNGPV